ncbi:MAG: hypothetical protein U9O98_07400 [Asgard group archaeon]|nr:hypothetical protein [Asgard group archaeon]
MLHDKVASSNTDKQKNNKYKEKAKTSFLPAICPKTQEIVNSQKCYACPHKKFLRRGNKHGRFLLTMICNWSESDGESQDK